MPDKYIITFKGLICLILNNLKCLFFSFKKQGTKSFIIFIYSTISISLFSQSSGTNLHFYHINTKNNLQSDYINTIIQDNEGLMWFGTVNGLFNFDGQNVSSYLFEPYDSTSISGNMIHSFHIDNKNNLWIGTNFGLCKYLPESNNFKRIVSSTATNQRNSVLDIKQDKNNQLIICSPNNIQIYNPKTEKLEDFIFAKNIIGVKENERFSKIFFDQYKRLWICSQFHFIIFDWPDKQYTIIDHNCGFVRNVFQSDEPNVWISSANGLFVLNTHTHILKKFITDQLNNKIISDIWDTKMDNAGNLWIGTSQEGLIRYNLEKQEATIYSYNELNNNGLGNNNIRSIYTDRQGIIWVGTQYQGVSYALIDNIKKFNTNVNINSSLSSDIIASILEDSDGDLWLGTGGNGLNRIDKSTGTITKFKKEQNLPGGIKTNAILALLEDNNNNIWIGGYRGYITKYNYKSQKWKTYTNCYINNGIPTTLDIRRFFEDSKKRIWIATNGQGLFKYNYDTDDFTIYNTSNSGIIDDYILTIEEDNSNKLWLGTYFGVSVFNPESPGEKINYTNDVNDTLSISSNWVYCIHKDKSDNIWLGTAYGLNRYNPKNQKFIRYYNSKLFPGKEIYGILEDGINNQLWMSSNNGLVQLNLEDNSIKYFVSEDGLPNSIFLRGSYFKNKKNIFYFGTSNGLVSFAPFEIKADTFTPPIIITDIQVFYKSIPHHKYKNNINLTFNYQQSTITFKFIGLNYIMNSSNTYLYKLEGYDKNWNNIGNRNEATFTNLDPGKYKFKVKVINKDGFSNKQEAIINFTITPQWWKTLGFKIAAIILVVTLLFLILRLRVYQINKRNLVLEHIVQERTSELSEKNIELEKNAAELNLANELLLERQSKIQNQSNEINEVNQKLKSSNNQKDKLLSIIAHDLKNPFNSILGFTDMLKNSHNELTSDSREEYISIIYNASQKVYDLLDNLLIWGRSQMKKIDYEPENYNINNQIKENIIFFKEISTRKKIKISSHTPIHFFVYADINMINTVIRNLLSNAIKFTPENGKIDIYLNEKEDSILCAIKDNGTGIEPTLLAHLFDQDNSVSINGTLGEIGTGLGLIICNDFINKNSGKIWAESKINVGSTFYFSIPKSKSFN